jgi:4-hydroxy-3-methylbut-2-enyl diphosphate reductase
LTAGASAPETLVEDVIGKLREIEAVEVSVLPGIEEKVEFRLPAELRGSEHGGPSIRKSNDSV